MIGYPFVGESLFSQGEACLFKSVFLMANSYLNCMSMDKEYKQFLPSFTTTYPTFNPILSNPEKITHRTGWTTRGSRLQKGNHIAAALSVTVYCPVQSRQNAEGGIKSGAFMADELHSRKDEESGLPADTGQRISESSACSHGARTQRQAMLIFL